jgi:hypothetical protein
MKTFKEFLLSESDPLNDTSIEMWLRHRFKISLAKAVELHKVLTGETDELLGTEMYDWLYADYAAEMPYDVAKGRGNTEPDMWIIDQITGELQHAGLELE